MRCLAFIAAVLGTGCFYSEDINQRPSLDIRQRTAGFIHRGDKAVILDAVADDPEGHGLVFNWAVYACIDGADIATCDTNPFDEATTSVFEFDVPVNRTDVVMPISGLLITLNGIDEFGAGAKPGQQLAVPVRDAPPDLTAFDSSNYKHVAGTPIDLFIEFGDADDGASGVTIDVMVTPPGLATFNLTDLTGVPQPIDLTRRQIGKQLVPSDAGVWEIDIIATSVGGEVREVPYVINVFDDTVPCLEQLLPSVPPVGSVLPISEATLFQVLLVDDDLDRFPTIVGDPFLGPTRFAWSLKPQGGTRSPLTGATGNTVELDPASFTPGDVVELRVEVFDRRNTAVTCGDSEASCSVTADTCMQRRTWLVEVH